MTSRSVSLGIAMAINLFMVGLFCRALTNPAEVRAARPPDQGGLFVDTPQTLMAWGVIYFSLMTLCEVMIYRKHRQIHGEVTAAHP